MTRYQFPWEETSINLTEPVYYILCRLEVKIVQNDLVCHSKRAEFLFYFISWIEVLLKNQARNLYTRRAFEHKSYILQKYFALFNPGFSPEK